MHFTNSVQDGRGRCIVESHDAEQHWGNKSRGKGQVFIYQPCELCCHKEEILGGLCSCILLTCYADASLTLPWQKDNSLDINHVATWSVFQLPKPLGKPET